MDELEDDVPIKVVFHPEWPPGTKPVFYAPGTRLGGTAGLLHVREMAQLVDLTAWVNRGEPERPALLSIARHFDRGSGS